MASCVSLQDTNQTPWHVSQAPFWSSPAWHSILIFHSTVFHPHKYNREFHTPTPSDVLSCFSSVQMSLCEVLYSCLPPPCAVRTLDWTNRTWGRGWGLAVANRAIHFPSWPFKFISAFFAQKLRPIPRWLIDQKHHPITLVFQTVSVK